MRNTLSSCILSLLKNAKAPAKRHQSPRTFAGLSAPLLLLLLASATVKADTISIAGGSCGGAALGAAKTGGIQATLPVGGNVAATAWGFNCTISFANGDAFSISNGMDAASSNAAGNSFTFTNDTKATVTGAALLAPESFAVTISQSFATAAGLLPAAFSGTVNLSGNCSAALGAASTLNAGFTANNGTNLQSASGACNMGNIPAAASNFNGVNIAALNPGPANVLRITETLTFNFQNGAAVGSFISDPGSVTLSTAPEPRTIPLVAAGLIGLAGVLRRKLNRATNLA